MKNLIFRNLIFMFCILVAPALMFSAFSDSGNQYIPTTIIFESEEQQLTKFLQPVPCAHKTGLQEFFTTVFNKPLYVSRFLPSCLIHLTDLIEFGVNNNKTPAYFESVFNLFLQRLKECTWMNPYALLLFLERLPEFFDTLNDQKNEELTNAIKAELERALLHKFGQLKANPDAFLNETAHIIMTKVQQTGDASAIRSLQNSIHRFLDAALMKLIWNPYDKIDIWKSITAIAKKCELLYYYGIVSSTEDVNQLIWSLLYRFGYFIDCAGSQLKSNFYREIQNDIKIKNYSFLDIAEQDEALTTKKEYLNTILAIGETKALAQEQGIFSDGII